MTLGIIDYGMGNLHSVKNALKFLGYESIISSQPTDLNKCDKIILPGVGAFPDAMKALKKLRLDTWLKSRVKDETPLLGICLGMQLLFEDSTEHGFYNGLGLLNGHIKKLDVPLKIPHMGWNRLNIKMKDPLFKDLPEEAYVYFVHSYYLETAENIVAATTFYGKEIQIAASSINNIYALQFHPEKSGNTGLQILKNFALL